MSYAASVDMSMKKKRLFSPTDNLIRWFLFWTHQVENKIHLSSYQKKQVCTFFGCILRLLP